MKFEQKSGSVLGGSAALFNASMDDLRVLLCLLEDGTRGSAALSEAAGCSLSRVEGAISYWKEAGVIEQEGSIVSLRGRTVRDGQALAAAIDAYGLSSLLDECQLLLGHTLNQSEIHAVIGMIEDMHLDAGYILTLLSYCIEKERGSIGYAERVAATMVDRGITTVSDLDDYIKKEQENADLVGLVRKLFGIQGRAFSKVERECIARWREYGYGEDVIGLAYDIAVGATTRGFVKYADKILTRWYTKGCKTLAECEAAREAEWQEKKTVARRKEKTPLEQKSFDTSDFFKKALERSYQGSGIYDTNKKEGEP